MAQKFTARTAYGLLVDFAGMSLPEAAAYQGVQPQTAASWSAGRRACPPAAIEKLRELIAQQEAEAERHLNAIAGAMRAAANTKFEGQLLRPMTPAPATEEDAQKLGYPCVGAWRAMAARVVARAPRNVEFGETA